MIFAGFYKHTRSPLAKLRHHPPTEQRPSTPPSKIPAWSGEDLADLISRDKTKVKDAVKRYLAARVRNDWEFVWPPTAAAQPAESKGPASKLEPSPLDDLAKVQDEVRDDDGYQNDDAESDFASPDEAGNDSEQDAASIYSVVSEDPTHYRALIEWDSDVPLDDDSPTEVSPLDHHGDNLTKLERRARQRRELRKEMEYNEGLACFEARRAAWTQARTVRVRVKPEAPPSLSPQRSPRRFFFRRSVSGSPTSPFQTGQSTGTVSATSSEGAGEKDADKEISKHVDRDSTSRTSEQSSASSYPVETIVPIAQPILPPHNPLRASIQPSHYLQLYDKLIVNNLTPSCPINLSDMINACVAGWKRDGEWPPRPALPIDPVFAAYGAKKKKRASVGTAEQASTGRRLSLTKLLSRDKDHESQTGKAQTGKGVRQSLQRALGLGPHIEVPVGGERSNI